MERISRENMFMQIADTVSKRSECTRKHVGAVLTLSNRIIAIGYNGVLPNTPPEEGLDSDGNSKTIHAEANIIAFCARHGIPTEGTTIYVTLQPCMKCAELLVQAGIKNVFYSEDYRCTDGLILLRRNGIEVEKVLSWGK